MKTLLTAALLLTLAGCTTQTIIEDISLTLNPAKQLRMKCEQYGADWGGMPVSHRNQCKRWGYK